MNRTSHLSVIVLLALSLAAAAIVPSTQPAEAAVDSISFEGDCAGVTVTVQYSRFGADDVPNNLSAWATIPEDPVIPISDRSATEQLLPAGATSAVVFTIPFSAPLPNGTLYVLHVDQWVGHTEYDPVTGDPFVVEEYYDSHEEYINCVASTPDDPENPPVIVPVPGGDAPPASRGTSTGESATNAPGPEMVFMPSWSVMGQFNAATELLYAPNASARTGIVMEAGKTAYVLGLDESGEFRQIVFNGSYLWVPVASMQPVDAWPWNGRGLPGEVVNFSN
ncbi:hypothetical protein [Aggregatilinea lenta]|uniref:hypothetical protein n=1 Tax=Aggregatilinea lenta TaxID=913108 RepID=UPI0013C32E0A|nr:hypothetical protein [Aggregatilinea lenta]